MLFLQKLQLQIRSSDFVCQNWGQTNEAVEMRRRWEVALDKITIRCRVIDLRCIKERAAAASAICLVQEPPSPSCSRGGGISGVTGSPPAP